MFYKIILCNLLFLLSAEIAHSLVIAVLKKMPLRKPIESLNINFFGDKLSSPVPIAAGFDKNAEVIRLRLSTGSVCFLSFCLAVVCGPVVRTEQEAKTGSCGKHDQILRPSFGTNPY
jgi:hypothetical protein